MPREAVIFDRIRCRFLPHALVVRVGQPIRVINADPIASNVHTFPQQNPSANFVVAPNDREGVSLLFEKPEIDPVAVRCDYYAWMSAWHLPLDHPFAVVTNAKGEFAIAHLPAGKHELLVWQEKAGFLENKLVVEILRDQSVSVELKYASDKFT